MSETAEATALIHADRDAVWRAITDPDLIAQYLYGTRVESEWTVGSPIVYRGEWEGKPYEDHGTILEFVPGERLVSSYYSPLSGKPDVPESYQDVAYTLGSDGDDTRVTITQSGCADRAEADRMSTNWASTLEGLRAAVER